MADVVDLEGVIERQKIGGFLLVTLTMGVAVQFIEGFDLVAAGVAGPALANSLHIERAYLGFIFSSFFIGLVFGALLFGVLGDIYGRKSITIVSTLWYGAFSIATIGVGSMGPLVVLRFLTGFGLGGVLPTTIALMCEYAPSRMRATVLNVMICGLNVGGAIGGFAGAKFIPVYGWHFIFYVGGIVPILLVPMFMLWLPESVRFWCCATRRGSASPRSCAKSTRSCPSGPKRSSPSVMCGSRAFRSVTSSPRDGRSPRSCCGSRW